MTSGYSQNLKFQCKAAGLPVPEVEIRFHPVRRWRLDLGWKEHMLAVEVDGGTWIGGRHNRGAGYERDCEKLNAAILAGWRVLRVTTAMVKDGRALGTVEQALKGIAAMFVALMLVGCSSTPTGPTPVDVPKQADATPPAPLPPVPGLNSPVPVWVVSGNNAIEPRCEDARPVGNYLWNVFVSDSGPKVLTRVLSMVHHDHTAGCGSTLSNPRDYLQVNAQQYFSPHTFGTLQLAFDSSRFSCGRVQVDASFLDADGKEWLVLGTVINYGVNCASTVPIPPPQPPVVTIPTPVPPSTPPTPPSVPTPPVVPPVVPPTLPPELPPQVPPGRSCAPTPTGRITEVLDYHARAEVTAGRVPLTATFASSGSIKDSQTQTAEACATVVFNISKAKCGWTLTLSGHGVSVSQSGAACQ